jgi:hypothetical protein
LYLNVSPSGTTFPSGEAQRAMTIKLASWLRYSENYQFADQLLKPKTQL